MPQYPYTPYNGYSAYPSISTNTPLYNQPSVGAVPQYPTIPPRPVMPQRAINGMVVQSADAITADCVPMDGSIAVFPKQDMSEIYVKNWNADGTIHTVTYKPVEEIKPEAARVSAVTELSASVDDKLNELTGRMNRLESSFNKMQAKQNQRKENSGS